MLFASRTQKTSGFGLVEVIIGVGLIVFVVASFMVVMLRSIRASRYNQSYVEINLVLDNRVAESRITGNAIDTSDLPSWQLSLQDNVFEARNENEDMTVTRTVFHGA